ncbi:MAG: sigma-54-dependent Fis family transcriptional regulator [Pseudomonadales bacterium]|nr:sigma-54-dependent Fis family transcriptional regulator [Pseudomonadales bacterium]
MLNEHRLSILRKRLELVNQSWTSDQYRHLQDFYVRILPSIMQCERCGIFVVDSESGEISSTAGTGLEHHKIIVTDPNSVVGRVIGNGEVCIHNEMDTSTGFHEKAGRQTGFSSRNILCVPILSITSKNIMGAVEVLNALDEEGFLEKDVELLNEVASYLAMAMENNLISRDILSISNTLNQEVSALRGESGSGIIATSDVMMKVLEEVQTVAPLPVSVMIFGENGTGKEQIANMIHDLSSRCEMPLVAVNCAAIPETLIESEFFGYEKGAFTGATDSKAGRLEEAEGGTLFLDEIGEMPLAMQPKFLRVLQESEGARLGSNKVVKYDLRIVCATNKNLREEVKAGRFREDLYYRLFAIEITLPPLRERSDDIIVLALSFLDELRETFGKMVGSFEPDVLDLFQRYQWPGNVRQLRREIERLVALSPENESIRSEYCSEEVKKACSVKTSSYQRHGLTLTEEVESLERLMIESALGESKGNKAEAARQLGISRQGLHKKLNRYQML